MRKRTPTFRKRPSNAARTFIRVNIVRISPNSTDSVLVSCMTNGRGRMFWPCKRYTRRECRPVSVDSVLDRFRRVGALLEGHFRLTSGLHSPGYLQCALVLQHPREAEACGAEIAAKVRDLKPAGRAFAGPWGHCHRAGSRTGPGRPGDFCRASGREADVCGAVFRWSRGSACSSLRTS